MVFHIYYIIYIVLYLFYALLWPLGLILRLDFHAWTDVQGLEPKKSKILGR